MPRRNRNEKLVLRVLIGAACASGLVFVFVSQRFNIAAWLQFQPETHFFFNRTVRFIVNDTLTIGIIWALFHERKYVIFSLWIQVLGMVFLLFPYFLIKHRWPSYNGPLVSFLHRLVLNPTILLLLIPSFYFHGKRKS